MRYALLVYSAPGGWDEMSEEEQRSIVGEYIAVGRSPGVYGGEQLQSVETATTVRMQNGSALVTDGPFAETKEVFGGFYLLEADDIDSALEVAKRIPSARLGGSVEVRPLVERPS
jgi:hypothetical protein